MGIETARVDAELLAAHVLGVPRGRLLLVDELSAEQAGEYRRLVAARAQRTPVQFLTGRAPFRNLDLAVGPGVFVPRPETEPLVSWGLATLGSGGPGAAPIVVDLCSGSGAIALAVAHECPHATVYAVEDSPSALTWLHRNASGSRVTVVEADATDLETLSAVDGQADLVLCNPPYVPSGTPLPPEVTDHDPHRAVFAGPDGLAVIRRVIARAGRLLRPGGHLAVEHDDRHGRAVPELLRADGRYEAVEDHPDLAGRPRFATARRLADFTVRVAGDSGAGSRPAAGAAPDADPGPERHPSQEGQR